MQKTKQKSHKKSNKNWYKNQVKKRTKRAQKCNINDLFKKPKNIETIRVLY